ncbi:MAG: hypothetical protein JST80_11595 [Bdellovibrionales bacterium]|nr:hypothetical protein [Bdellovibrionales bacterium]
MKNRIVAALFLISMSLLGPVDPVIAFDPGSVGNGGFFVACPEQPLVLLDLWDPVRSVPAYDMDRDSFQSLVWTRLARLDPELASGLARVYREIGAWDTWPQVSDGDVLSGDLYVGDRFPAGCELKQFAENRIGNNYSITLIRTRGTLSPAQARAIELHEAVYIYADRTRQQRAPLLVRRIVRAILSPGIEDLKDAVTAWRNYFNLGRSTGNTDVNWRDWTGRYLLETNTSGALCPVELLFDDQDYVPFATAWFETPVPGTISGGGLLLPIEGGNVIDAAGRVWVRAHEQRLALPLGARDALVVEQQSATGSISRINLRADSKSTSRLHGAFEFGKPASSMNISPTGALAQCQFLRVSSSNDTVSRLIRERFLGIAP